jgi:hypothetical protein
MYLAADARLFLSNLEIFINDSYRFACKPGQISAILIVLSSIHQILLIMADTSHIWIAKVYAAIMRWLSIPRDFSDFSFSAFPFAITSAHEDLPKAREPRRLTITDQWNYLSDIIMGAASRAEEAARCHASATLQLDLAQYALTSLVDELSGVMEMGGRRRRATVHVLGVTPSPSRRAIGDAIAA